MKRTCVLVATLLLTLAVGTCSGGGGGNGGPTAPPAPAGSTVELQDFRYTPMSLTIQPGTTVRWVLRGGDLTHTVTAKDGTFDSGFVFTQQGALFERTFTEADRGKTFEYDCLTHTDTHGMKGSIRVGDSAPPPSPGY